VSISLLILFVILIPVEQGDGPIVLILAPTRELAVQIQEESTNLDHIQELEAHVSMVVHLRVHKYGTLEEVPAHICPL
jgi:superfamily II DNA/RNA helicase